MVHAGQLYREAADHRQSTRYDSQHAPGGFIGCARALQQLGYDAQLQAITTPTLLLVGVEDNIFPELNRAMHARIPGSRLVLIPAAGHLSNLEQPDAFSAALLEFLDTGREATALRNT
jgi:3-oxoadipate enol-lactonase